MTTVNIIGAGLAGCEAAHQLTKKGISVRLFEMKPGKRSPAHHEDGFAELVCSNSLRADRLENAVGLLKEEMRLLDSLIMKAADGTRVPAGGALAVDRYKFSDYITQAIRANPLVTVIEKEAVDLSGMDGIVIIATGPLTSDPLAVYIAQLTGEEHLHFFDAAAPIVTAESLDRDKIFEGSRYGRGSDYLNCPMTREEYQRFYEELVSAECAELKDFEQEGVFEGCMPVEVMAKRGIKTLLFGPLKPVGLVDPRTGQEAYAVVQLRKEDVEGVLYNLVGFQTHLKFPEQKRVFGLIPGLERAEYARYGVMHRNTYINGPKILDRFFRMKSNPNVFFAGQISGVEGYVESAASGLAAGLAAAAQAKGEAFQGFSRRTAIGALGSFVSESPSKDFQPMNMNFGIMEPCDKKIRNKAEKNRYIGQRALEEVRAFMGGAK